MFKRSGDAINPGKKIDRRVFGGGLFPLKAEEGISITTPPPLGGSRPGGERRRKKKRIGSNRWWKNLKSKGGDWNIRSAYGYQTFGLLGHANGKEAGEYNTDGVMVSSKNCFRYPQSLPVGRL